MFIAAFSLDAACVPDEPLSVGGANRFGPDICGPEFCLPHPTEALCDVRVPDGDGTRAAVSRRVQSTVDGFGQSSNSPTALNVRRGHRGGNLSPSVALNNVGERQHMQHMSDNSKLLSLFPFFLGLSQQLQSEPSEVENHRNTLWSRSFVGSNQHVV